MLNSVNIQGRLVRDPELREITGGKKVAAFTLAVDRNKDAADFIRCVAWDKTAETISTHTHKGDMIVCSGRLSVRPWKDKEGKTREETNVVVYEFSFCGGRKAETPEKPLTKTFEDLTDDGELPF